MSTAAKEIYFVNGLIEHYEKLLKGIGIELSDFPDTCRTHLEEYAKIKEETKLAELNLTNIEEHYYSKVKEYIDRSEVVDQLETDIEDLEKKVKKETEAIEELEKFYGNAIRNTVTETEVEKTKIMIDSQIKVLLQNHQKCPPGAEDVDLLELISKIELLEKEK